MTRPTGSRTGKAPQPRRGPDLCSGRSPLRDPSYRPLRQLPEPGMDDVTDREDLDSSIRFDLKPPVFIDSMPGARYRPLLIDDDPQRDAYRCAVPLILAAHLTCCLP